MAQGKNCHSAKILPKSGHEQGGPHAKTAVSFPRRSARSYWLGYKNTRALANKFDYNPARPARCITEAKTRARTSWGAPAASLSLALPTVSVY